MMKTGRTPCEGESEGREGRREDGKQRAMSEESEEDIMVLCVRGCLVEVLAIRRLRGNLPLAVES